MVFFLDNLSRLTFLRTMPLTAAWMEEEMKSDPHHQFRLKDAKSEWVSADDDEAGKAKTVAAAGGLGSSIFQFFRYHILGKSSPSNMTPMLKGHFFDDNRYNRRLPYVWEKFKDAGYVTGWFAQQCVDYFELDWGRESAVDHQLMELFCEKSYGLVTWGHRCLRQKYSFEHVFDYLKSYTTNYKDTLKFSMSLWMEAHDNCFGGTNGVMDEGMRDMLQWMKVEGHLNRTAIVLLSDHGPWKGKYYRSFMAGRQEHSLPMLNVILPKWYARRYPKRALNMWQNQQRLVTAFNVFETLSQIVPNLDTTTSTTTTAPAASTTTTHRASAPKFVWKDRGYSARPPLASYSLFDEIPDTASCEKAGMGRPGRKGSELCMCGFEYAPSLAWRQRSFWAFFSSFVNTCIRFVLHYTMLFLSLVVVFAALALYALIRCKRYIDTRGPKKRTRKPRAVGEDVAELGGLEERGTHRRH
eukprot:TRINITY_DN1917_c0_g2_i1.p1 TRINITY_DN1917_c0_g2~~TRINITY_DN1917_c0_g2_i1.p1  ORF type:complete len:481 (+),score=100.37 TRINITY_DN1917_c0_g2_i1:41-1444(+)